MPSNYWLKLYRELLHDPKMAMLENHLWRRVIEFSLLASQEGSDRNILPPVDDMKWVLHVSGEALATDINALVRLHYLDVYDDGELYVTDWQKKPAHFAETRSSAAYQCWRGDVTVAQAEEQIERMSHRPNPWDGLVNALNGDDLLLDAAIDSFRDEAEMCLDIGGSSAGLSDYYSKIADGIERWLKMAEKLRQVEAERGTLQDEVRELYELLDAATVF